MDTAKLDSYSDDYLKELRAGAVQRVDAARLLVARGAIGGTRKQAVREISEGRAERDAIDAVLSKRVVGVITKVEGNPNSPVGDVEGPITMKAEPIAAEPEIVVDEDLFLDDPEKTQPIVERRDPLQERSKRKKR